MPRKGGSGGNEIFGQKPRLSPIVEELLAFAIEDEEAGKDMPLPALPHLFARRDAALRLAAEGGHLDLFDQFGAVFEERGLDLASWLSELPYSLADAKLVDEAVDLLRKLDPLLPGDRLTADIAEILANAGRRDEALVQVETNLAGAEDAWAFARAADVLEMLGEKSRAQILYRRAQALAEDREDRYEFITREIPLLEELGRAEEAKALRDTLALMNEAATEEALEQEEDVLEEPEPLRTEPEPARNAPCPCGSGKKYKRCCGKAE